MVEIERKYLIQSDHWLGEKIKAKHEIQQAYLFQEEGKSLRIRLNNNQAFLTIKMGKGISRNEFEYEIPANEAHQMIQAANLKSLQKTRYEIQFDAHIWEVDVFHGKHEGLLLAEIELSSEEESFKLPNWIGVEVTNDPRYLNANLFKAL